VPLVVHATTAVRQALSEGLSLAATLATYGGVRWRQPPSVTGVRHTDPWAKAGVMIRDTLDPGSRHATVVLTPGNGVAFQQRLTAGGFSTNMNLAGVASPHWVRVVCESVVGQAGQFRLSGLHSFDGVNWAPVGPPIVLGLGAAVKAGLVVSSHTVTTNEPNSLIGLEELNPAHV
jgi:hypothetical protein